MPGIELSEMTEDLVFDDRPVVKPKPQSAQLPANGVAKKPDSSEPIVSAKINAPEVELSLDLTPEPAAKVNRSSTPAQVSPPSVQVARPTVQPTPPPVQAAPPPVQAAPPPVQAAPPPVQVAPPPVQVAPPPVQAAPPPVQAAPPPVQVAPPPVQAAAQPVQVDSRSSGEPVVSGGLLLNERRKVRQDVTSAQKKEALDLFETLIASAAKGGASDLLLKRGQVPMFRWNGELFPSRNGPRLDSSFLETLASVLLSKAHCERLNEVNDVDLSFQSQRGGRTRVNIFSQCGELGLVARLIPSEIPTFEKLEMDANLKRLVDQKRGLVLVTGATGSGKSTTLAALLDYINSTRTAHIITIEDPIEFIHHDKRSMFNQRELGLDTRGYAEALRSALRQAPDVILVGELRDSETMEVALQAAETGHLVLSTLHTNDAADSILRILGLTGQEKEAIVRQQLADTLRGVISQRLVKRSDKSGRVAAQEVMINTATIRERLLKGAHPSVVRDFIAQGSNQGMRTFDQHLIQLVKAGIVEYDEALKNASNRDDFTLRFSGVSDGREAS